MLQRMFKPSPSQPQSPAKLPETDQKEVTSVLDENGANGDDDDDI